MDNEIDNTTHNEIVFRNFIRSHQLTKKWHEFIKDNPLEVRQINLLKKTSGIHEVRKSNKKI